jgi:hypothetical protein
MEWNRATDDARSRRAMDAWFHGSLWAVWLTIKSLSMLVFTRQLVGLIAEGGVII